MNLLGTAQAKFYAPTVDVSKELAVMQKEVVLEYFTILLSLTRLLKTLKICQDS
jgi:hypothetical protein